MILERYGHEIERLGKRYRLERSLGSGGMADVCLAVDELEQRKVAIKVSQTCTAISYDTKELQALTTNLLSQQVAQDSKLGRDYRLVGVVATDAIVKSVSNSTVFLNVSAKGTYAYSKLNAKVGKFSRMIKGMTTTQAIATLKSQPHVAAVSISDVILFLPSDSSKIAIKVRTLSGLSTASSKSGG